MRHPALLVGLASLVGCIEGGPPDPTEMVVYSVPDRYGDVIVADGMIRWTDGMKAYEAKLADMPIDGRYTEPLAETNRHLAVNGDTVYVSDGTGILSFTNGTKSRVVTQPSVYDPFVTDDNTLYWSHLNGFSWFGSGGQEQSVYTEASVVELVSVGADVYVTTIGSYSVPPLGALVTRSKLFKLDRASKTTTEIADGADFVEEFVDDGHFGASDVYETGGLYVIDGSLYWSVFLHTQFSEYQQRLVQRMTTSGWERVLDPQPRAHEIMVDGGAFYWNVDDVLWRATPSGTPERVLGDKFFTIEVADGYAYGFVPAISGVGYDLRRISLSPATP